jgi:hypothetical protein
MIGLITGRSVDVDAVMGDVFTLVCNFHVPLDLNDGCPSSGAGCDIALVFIFLCVGLMAIFGRVTFFSGFLSIGVYFVPSQSWCGISRLLRFCVFSFRYVLHCQANTNAYFTLHW